MSTHSYTRCWLHLIWETLRREPMLDKRAAARASVNLSEYSYQKSIYMKINYFNAEHTHALIDLPTNLTIRTGDTTLEGWFISLDQSEPSGQRQVCLGARIRSFLGLAFRCK